MVFWTQFNSPLVTSPAAAKARVAAPAKRSIHVSPLMKLSSQVQVPKSQRGGAAGYYPGVTWVTESTEQFAREWPELYKRQQATLRNIKDLHKPVHLHGKSDATMLAALATVCVGGVFYSVYRMTRYVMPE